MERYCRKVVEEKLNDADEYRTRSASLRGVVTHAPSDQEFLASQTFFIILTTLSTAPSTYVPIVTRAATELGLRVTVPLAEAIRLSAD